MRVIEMNFLPDVYVHCEKCNGKRYNRETLEIRYKGKSISDVLDMTVDEAVEFFKNVPYLYRKIKVLQEVGLGYITLGQSAVTLSGGEAQRVKLATELSKKDTGKTFYILDEPTTGLHFQDIQHLLDVLNKLVDRGNTVLVIEHNLDVIKVADHVIDLGPEGGEGGGKILFEGHTAEELEELGIMENRAIGLLKLAQTFLASEGEIDKMRSMRSAFEDDKLYEVMFTFARLNADPRKIVLCYKAQERLGRMTREILEKGTTKYAFLPKARLLLFALMVQAVLNDNNVERWAEGHGKDMVISADFAKELYNLASTKCRPILSELIAMPMYADKVAHERYDFLRTHAAFKHAMRIAEERYGWAMKRLR